MDVVTSAKEIVDLVGGRENIIDVVHCMTRLRFTLKDEEKAKANEKAIKKLKVVKGVMNAGGQFQVVIGTEVPKYYKEVLAIAGLGEGGQAGKPTKKLGVFDTIANFAGAIMSPLIRTIAAIGLMNLIISIVVLVKPELKEAQEYYLLKMFADAFLYAFPIFVGFSAGKKFGVNMYTSAFMGFLLIAPKWVALVEEVTAAGGSGIIRFFGIPFQPIDYANSMIPIILIVWLQSYVEPFWDRVIHPYLKMMFVSALTIITCMIVGYAVLGPIGNWIGQGMMWVVNILENNLPFLMPVLVGTLFPLLVSLGIHTLLIMTVPVQALASQGYDQSVFPAMGLSNAMVGIACLITALYYFKGKNGKSLNIASGIQGILGITEPGLYGTLLPLKTPLYGAMAGGFAGGIIQAIFQTKSFIFGGSLKNPAAYIAPDGMPGAGSLNNLMSLYLSVIVGGVICFIVIKLAGGVDEYAAGLDEFDKEGNILVLEPAELTSIVKGEVIPLTKVKDQPFAEGILGKGLAIVPEENQICSPINGVIRTVFPTKHAIGLETANGAEILIHIGIDTVKLNGEGFTVHVIEGQEVKQGDLLVTVDINLLKEKGYDITIPVVVTNSANFDKIEETIFGNVGKGEKILVVE